MYARCQRTIYHRVISDTLLPIARFSFYNVPSSPPGPRAPGEVGERKGIDVEWRGLDAFAPGDAEAQSAEAPSATPPRRRCSFSAARPEPKHVRVAASGAFEG